MLQRFVCIREKLISASADEDSDIPMNNSVNFGQKAKRYCKMLREIDHVTERLQYHEQTVGVCRADVAMLMEVSVQNKKRLISPFFNGNLRRKYISQLSPIVNYLDFETAVKKIQTGNAKSLRASENESVSHLMLTEDHENRNNERRFFQKAQSRRKLKRVW